MSKQENRTCHGLGAVPRRGSGFLFSVDGNILGNVLVLKTRTKDNAKITLLCSATGYCPLSSFLCIKPFGDWTLVYVPSWAQILNLLVNIIIIC
jgi:hypothetical protein